jgi:hypothetical protein
MLNGDAAAQGFDAFQIFIGHSFAMVEEPIQPLERNFTIDLLEHFQETRDAFVISCVQTERPFIRSQQ